jgi:hypothetical protein
MYKFLLDVSFKFYTRRKQLLEKTPYFDLHIESNLYFLFLGSSFIKNTY